MFFINENDFDFYWYDIDLYFVVLDDGEEEMCLLEFFKIYCNIYGISLFFIFWLVIFLSLNLFYF